MLESLQNIQKEIEYILNQTSKNDPLYENLMAIKDASKEIKNHFIDDGK